MKNYTIVLAIILFLIGCLSSDTQTSDYPIIKTESLNKYFPINLLANSSFAIFHNAEGQERKLRIEYSEVVKEKIMNNVKYKVEVINVNYLDDSNYPFTIYIEVDGHYDNNNLAYKYLNIGLFQQISVNFFTPKIDINETGATLFSDYFENFTFFNKSYSHVYRNNNTPPDMNMFTELFYSVEYGVLAFRDHNDELWVFSSFIS